MATMEVREFLRTPHGIKDLHTRLVAKKGGFACVPDFDWDVRPSPRGWEISILRANTDPPDRFTVEMAEDHDGKSVLWCDVEADRTKPAFRAFMDERQQPWMHCRPSHKGGLQFEAAAPQESCAAHNAEMLAFADELKTEYKRLTQDGLHAGF